MQPNAEHETGPRATFERVERSDQIAHRLVGAAAVVLVLAIVKPWGVIDRVPPARESASTATTAPIPSPGRSGSAAASPGGAADSSRHLDPNETRCMNSPDWLLVTLERDGTELVRTWRVIQPATGVRGEAPGPLTPIDVGAAELLGIGLCPPTTSGDPPEVPIVGAWAASRHGPIGAPLAAIPTIDNPEPGIARLYGHPAGVGSYGSSWPSGRFVFEALDPTLDADHVVWVSVVVVARGRQA